MSRQAAGILPPTTFSSREVMRFFGRTRLPKDGRVDVRFNGEAVTDLTERPEGIRIKHPLEREFNF